MGISSTSKFRHGIPFLYRGEADFLHRMVLGRGRLWRPGSATLVRAMGFGLLRLTIGMAFGITIFFAASIEPEDVIWKYIAIYAPVRMVEWFIMALMIGRTSANQTTLNSILWCLGGIVVSFAADFASPQGVAGHFCVGRCLC